MSKLQDKPMVDQILEAIEEGKGLIRELHGVEKDLKRVINEAKELRAETMQMVTETLEEVSRRELARIAPSVRKANEITIQRQEERLEEHVMMVLNALDQVKAKYDEAKMAMARGETVFDIVPADPGPLPIQRSRAKRS